ncbi:MAG: hypothetical protein WKF84_22665 [Pyrinomonadaceae bacterium]
MLPSFVAAAITAGLGGLSLMALTGGTVTTILEERSLFAASFWDWISAAETAAWRLKFILMPLALGATWASWRAYFRILRRPAEFTGKGMSVAGFASSCAALTLLVTLIGVTIPVRLEKQEIARSVKNDVPLYSFNRALIEYRIRYGSYPADMSDLKKLPDADGSIAKLLAQFPSEGYTASAQKASVPASKSGKLRAPRLRQAALRDNADDSDTGGDRISFTNYILKLPGKTAC